MANRIEWPDNIDLKLPCFGIVVSITGDGAGSITSDLEDLPEFDAIESLVLAHACAGIAVTSPAYVEGIETSVQGIGNNHD